MNQILWHTLLLSSFVYTSPLAVTTVVGFLVTLTVSNSAEFGSFMLSMCIDAPEHTTNSFSSGFITDGAGRHHSLLGEKKVALSVSLNFKILLANLSAPPRAHRSCLSVSSWDRSSNFGAYGLRWWGFLTRITPSDEPLLFRMFAWRSAAVETWHVDLVPRLLCLSVKSMRIAAAHCSEIHNPTVVNLSKKPLHLCHHPSSVFCWVHLQPACGQTRTFLRICIPILFCRIDVREDANNHKMVSCTYLWCNLCAVVEQTSQMDFGLWDSFFSICFYHPLLSVVQRDERILVSILHAYFRRAGNCTYLLLNRVLCLSIDSILLVLFHHLVDPAICNQCPCFDRLISGIKFS